MAVLAGSIQNIHAVEGLSWDPGIQYVEIVFTLGGTYVQAENAILSAIPTAIAASRRNGKTVTLVDVIMGRPARSAVDNSDLFVKTAAVSTADVTFEVATVINSTEYTNALALPALNRPFSMIVAFTEA